MIKEAIEYLQTLVKTPDKKTIEGFNFLISPNDMEVQQIMPAIPEPLEVGSLTGLIEYLKNADPASELWPRAGVVTGQYVVHIPSYNHVNVLSGLEYTHMTRRRFIEASVAKSVFPERNFLPIESFIIAVLTNFVQTSEREELLKFVSAIRVQASREEIDEGVSQKVTVKTGITTIADAVVPNPVTLRPYVTFAEIEQPEQSYAFRIDGCSKPGDPITCGLFPIKSNEWKTRAVNSIREYLKAAFNDTDVPAVIIS